MYCLFLQLLSSSVEINYEDRLLQKVSIRGVVWGGVSEVGDERRGYLRLSTLDDYLEKRCSL